MKALFGWVILFACWLGAMPVLGVPTERLAEVNPERIAEIYVNHSVNPATGAYAETQVDLQSPGQHLIAATRHYGMAPQGPCIAIGDGWWLAFNAETVQVPVGPWVEVRRLSPDGGRILNWMRYQATSDADLILEACDGSFCRYYLDDRRQLTQVEYSTGHSLYYQYQQAGTSGAYAPVRREDDEGRYLVNELDPATGRVVSQWAPLGSDSTPILATRYVYAGDRTEVIDAAGNRSIYHHHRGRVVGIDTEIAGALYRRERLTWSGEKLGSYAILDTSGLALGVRAFAYDHRGHCIRTTLFGDLTGHGIALFALNAQGLPASANVEGVSIHYSYSNDEASQLLSVREDSGRMVTFSYDPETSLLVAKFLWEDAIIRQRLFYRYNADATLIEMIVDDGSSFDRDNLQGVTERRVKSIIPREQLPSLGLPVVVDSTYWDRELGVERVMQSTVGFYDLNGRIVKQDMFDGNGDHCGFTEYRYDSKGRLEATLDATGQLSSDEGASYQYDRAGRLILKQMNDDKGHSFTSHFRYNVLGQMIESIDLYGNETLSSYDALGRCLTTRYPAVLSASDTPVRPEISRTYDLLDRPVTITDANGYITRIRYNIRGQPVEMTHPDGTSECYGYSLNGQQMFYRDRQGCCTRYQRDCFGRALEKRKTSPDGQSVTTQAFYNSFHLIGVVGGEGERTCFTYDGAGRVVEAFTQWEQGEQHRTFHYDVKGRLQEAFERFGLGDQDCSRLLIDRSDNAGLTAHIVDGNNNELVASEYLKPQKSSEDIHCDSAFVNMLGQKVLRKTVTDALGMRTITTYDALGHVVEVEEQDAFGKRLSQRRLRYDPAGYCILDQVYPLTGASPWTMLKRYGPMHRLEEMVEGVGTELESHTVYSYNAKGMLEQLVKPNGKRLKYAYDGFGHILELSASDGSVGYRYRYDACGRPVEIKDLIDGSVNVCRYDARNEVLHETLGNGLAMDYTRDGKGRLIRLELPDHSSILYHYDAALLRSIERQSPEGDTRYSHVYERYSSGGHLECERLIGGLGTVTYERDAEGHRNATLSRYWSEQIVKGGYDPAGNLTQIDIADRGGVYRMRFAYDCQGRLVGEAGAGTSSYAYDGLNNRVAKGLSRYAISSANQVVETPHAYYTYDANGNRLTMRGADVDVRYEYDALDRLTAVESPGQQRVEYRYDALHRRLSKTLLTWDETKGQWSARPTIRYLYEGRREIAAVDESGAVQELRVLGPGVAGQFGSAVAMEIDGGLYAPIHDHRGSVMCLVDASRGVVAEYARVSAFGEEQLYSANAQPLAPERALNPWRFSGKRCDTETGLIFFGRRFYDPELGRWLTRDPMGDIDGINDYAFVRNNPESLIDVEGLFSLQAVWRGFSEAALEYFRGVGSVASTFVDLFQRDLNLFTDISDTALYIGHQLIGQKIWDVLGFYSALPESGVVGQHEVSRYLRFSHINGIQNTREDALKAVAMISDLHGGANIHYTYRPTAGWTWDFCNCLLVKAGFTSPTAHCLADKWKRLIGDMGGVGGGGTIIHYAHSLGGAETESARHLLTAEEQGMIRVFTFGSPTLLSTGFKSATNYVARLDWVSVLGDPVNFFTGFFASSDTLILVGTYWGIPLVDHSLVNAVYRQVLDGLGKNYRQ